MTNEDVRGGAAKLKNLKDRVFLLRRIQSETETCLNFSLFESENEWWKNLKDPNTRGKWLHLITRPIERPQRIISNHHSSCQATHGQFIAAGRVHRSRRAECFHRLSSLTDRSAEVDTDKLFVEKLYVIPDPITFWCIWKKVLKSVFNGFLMFLSYENVVNWVGVEWQLLRVFEFFELVGELELKISDQNSFIVWSVGTKNYGRQSSCETCQRQSLKLRMVREKFTASRCFTVDLISHYDNWGVLVRKAEILRLQ